MTPYSGNNKVTFIAKKEKAAVVPKLGVMPKDATLVTPSASSTQQPNLPLNAFDGNTDTRWCASNGSYPQWLAWEFQRPVKAASINIVWEFERDYQFHVEGSTDGKSWIRLLDASSNKKANQGELALKAGDAVKHMRIVGLGSSGGWCSIREISVKGDGINTLWPAKADGKPYSYQPKLADPYAKKGNLPPTLLSLTPADEAVILKDVKVAEGFEATVFAAPPAVNYPVFVAASTDGTLYVSSDGNGSLGRDPERGRVIRLRDIDGDGRADETKVFCQIDAPRGLVWDHDRLYLVHPPHLSAFIDADGDGVAEEQKILVSNLAFGYDKRPADHTTNGLSIGVDGWLYIAGGDFGFMDASSVSDPMEPDWNSTQQAHEISSKLQLAPAWICLQETTPMMAEAGMSDSTISPVVKITAIPACTKTSPGNAWRHSPITVAGLAAGQPMWMNPGSEHGTMRHSPQTGEQGLSGITRFNPREQPSQKQRPRNR